MTRENYIHFALGTALVASCGSIIFAQDDARTSGLLLPAVQKMVADRVAANGQADNCQTNEDGLSYGAVKIINGTFTGGPGSLVLMLNEAVADGPGAVPQIKRADQGGGPRIKRSSDKGSNRASGSGPLAALEASCTAAQAAMTKINGDDALFRIFSEAVEAGDAATLKLLLINAGLGEAMIPGAQFHAINTKGTGANNNRADGAKVTLKFKPENTKRDAGEPAEGHQSQPDVTSGWVVIAEKTKLTSGSAGNVSRKEYIGHVTLMR